MRFLKGVFYKGYELRLRRASPMASRPRHVGIILDGNRRWARQSAKDVYSAYKAGGDKLQEVLRWCDQAGVPYVTAWMLSIENLQRDAAEVEPLCRAIAQTVKLIALRQDRRVVHLGSLERLPSGLRLALEQAESDTRHIQSPYLNVAVGYGGRDEIINAVQEIVIEHFDSGGSIANVESSVTADAVELKLYTKGQPDPDLIIRTSGEQRLSGFLLWQSAYAEFYFSDVLWPEFRSIDFWRSLRSYASRQRRFGK